MPAVAVVVVNWNGGAYLRRCIESLLTQSRKPQRILIVDNGSTDDSIQGVPPDPSVEILRLGHNTGFAAANNAAIRHLDNVDWIALLNPDAFAEPNWLQRLLEAADAHRDYAFFASRMQMDSEPGRIDGVGDSYHFTGLAWRRGHQLRGQNRYLGEEEVFSACAAAALYRRDALLAAGGFDERFFCYMEDVDLGFRLRLLGYRCLYTPRAVVSHVGSAATGKGSAFSVYHGHRNLVWTFIKNVPGALFWLLLLPHVLVNLLMILRYLMAGQGGVVFKAKVDAIRGLPAVWKQRGEIQRRRVVSARAILRVLSFGWPRAERFSHD